MNEPINSLVKQYVLWPELNNDFQKNFHFADTSIKEFQQNIVEVLDVEHSVEVSIIAFYHTNELLCKAREKTNGVLGVEELKLFDSYQTMLNSLSKEILAYIVICSLVESRYIRAFHNIDYHWEKFLADRNLSYPSLSSYNLRESINDISQYPEGKEFINSYYKDYASFFSDEEDFNKFKNFFIMIKSDIWEFLDNGHGERYPNMVNKFLNLLEGYSLKDVCHYLNLIFQDNNKFETGYGGKAWAQVINHAADFTQGKINSEVFIDQAFSLEHNNGNIFNKKFIFTQSEYVYNLYYLSTEERTPFSRYISICELLLHAQHNGNIFAILNLSKIGKQLSGENLYGVCDTWEKSNILPDKFKNKETNLLFLTSIMETSEYYMTSLKKITNELLKNYPQFTDIVLQDHPLDIKKTFQQVASSLSIDRNNNSDIYYKEKKRFLNATKVNNGYFDFWSFIHNDIYGIKKQDSISQNISFTLHDLENLPESSFDKNIIGGKAWSLANMNKLGLPVPKAKVFATDYCHAFYNNREQFNIVLQENLPSFNSYLTDESSSPILCSIRSGSAVSMPGMMDTVLNVGIDDSNYDYFCNTLGKQVTHKCINKFMELFCSSRLGIKFSFEAKLKKSIPQFISCIDSYNLLNPNDIIAYNQYSFFPLNKETQIKESLIAVFQSWNSPRAIAYRTEKNISHDLGTAAIVQQMVFGNLNENSCTGVVFSRDCLTGENKLVGEFLPKAQGEDVVSGSVTPFSIDKFKQFDSKSYNQLELISKQLEKTTGQIQDIEFTVEDGKLYILQHRQAVCSPIAAMTLLQDDNLNKELLLNQIESHLLQPAFSVHTKEEPCTNGLSANSGVLSGMVIKSEQDMILLQNRFNSLKKDNEYFGWIFYAELTSPEHMPLMNKTHAFITEQGGFTSHAAIIARSLNKPCIVGLGGNQAQRFKSGDIITIDATQGKIWNEIQPLVSNDSLAAHATDVILSHYNVKKEQFNAQDFIEYVDSINTKHSSWLLNLSTTKEIHNQPIKKQKFLDIGHKIAMILTANKNKELEQSLIHKPLKLKM